jgi:hypothetical protein
MLHPSNLVAQIPQLKSGTARWIIRADGGNLPYDYPSSAVEKPNQLDMTFLPALMALSVHPLLG